MEKHALTLTPGSRRAQCYTISSYSIYDNRTIAEQLFNDHQSSDGHLRAASLMVAAGCAEEVKTDEDIKKCLYGSFKFNDGSCFESD